MVSCDPYDQVRRICWVVGVGGYFARLPSPNLPASLAHKPGSQEYAQHIFPGYIFKLWDHIVSPVELLDS